MSSPIDVILDRLHTLQCNPHKSGDGWQAKCPSHEDRNPSLSISEGADGRTLLRCHAGCRFDSIISALDLKPTDLFADSPTRALGNGQHAASRQTKQLREDIENRIEALHQALSKDASAQRLLLDSRGITVQTATQFRIGWDLNQRRWSIPIRNADGLAVGLKYHRSDRTQTPKVISEPGSQVGLFGSDLLRPDDSLVVISEGELDAAAVWQSSGLHAVSGSGGAATVRGEWIKLLHGHPVTLWLDNDDAGEKALALWLDRLAPAVRNGSIPSVRIVRKAPADLKDSTDCLLKHGPEIIRALIESAEAWSPPDEEALTEVQDVPVSKPREAVRPVLVKLSDVEPEAVSFLWEPYLPLGKVTLIEGEPGDGKTSMLIQVAAHITTGRGWPGSDGKLGDRAEPGPVLYLSCEDGLADTIRPRFDRAGGDPTRFFALTGLSNGEPVFLSDHTMIENALAGVRPLLMVIDPIQGFLGARVDMHRANEIRPLLARLGNLAETYACAVAVIRHLRKSSGDHRLHRGLGSIDFVAHARSALRIGRDPNDPDSRAAIHIKSSCVGEGPAIGFKITNQGFEWTGTSTLSIEDMEFGETDPSAREEAVEFLRTALAGGPVPVKRIIREAVEVGISERTLKRAKSGLGIRASRSGFGREGGWTWQLP